MIWKDEAFSLWVYEWGIIYGEESASYKFLKNISDSFFLVNIVDNDFINGDLYAIIIDFIDHNQELFKQ